MTSSPSSAEPAAAAPAAAGPDVAQLAAEIAELKLDLWAARDAALGAVAAAGSLRARNAELEATIHALRAEVHRLAHVEESITFRIGSSVVRPLKAARRLVR